MFTLQNKINTKLLDLCVTSARRALSLEASLKTTIADTQGNAHSSVMCVGISSDIKVRHS